jgi:NDP-sugar pyrophosphorylase family protein
MNAIILAAGKGKRLRPITEWVPKPLLPIGGHPIIETLLTNLREAGIRRAVVIHGHLGGMLQRFLGNGAHYGVELIFREQRERLGTAHAVMQAVDLLESWGGEVMVLAGDTAFSREHIAGLMEFHRISGADVSLSLKRLPREKVAATSSVALEADGRVTHIVEKPDPDAAPSDIACAPLHIYPPSLVAYLPRVRPSPRGEYELTDVIAMMIADGLRVMGKLAPEAPNLTDQRDLLRLNFGYLREWL